MSAPLPEYTISGSYSSDRLRGARPKGSPRRLAVAVPPILLLLTILIQFPSSYLHIVPSRGFILSNMAQSGQSSPLAELRRSL